MNPALKATHRPRYAIHPIKRKRLVSVVAPAPQRNHMPLLVICFVVVLFIAISVPLIINTQLALMSYAIHGDQVKIVSLQEKNQDLTQRLDRRSSATQLRREASQAGLVPSGTLGYITLKTNKIEGGTPAQTTTDNE